MNAAPPALDDALLEAGELLLNGWGYNWYRREDLIRADDLLIRNHADAMLADTLAAFRRAETVFRNRHLRAPSREQPFPEAAAMDELRAFQGMVEDVEALRTKLRGAAMPPPDKIARAASNEAGLLQRLSSCDLAVAALTKAMRGEALSLTPAGLNSLPASMGPMVNALASAMEAREHLLGLP